MKIQTPIILDICILNPEFERLLASGMDSILKNLDSYNVYQTALYDLKPALTISNYNFECFLFGDNLIRGDIFTFIERLNYPCLQLSNIQYQYNEFEMINETGFFFEMPNEIIEYDTGVRITLNEGSNSILANMTLQKTIQSFNKLKYRQINLN